RRSRPHARLLARADPRCLSSLPKCAPSVDCHLERDRMVWCDCVRPRLRWHLSILCPGGFAAAPVRPFGEAHADAGSGAARRALLGHPVGFPRTTFEDCNTTYAFVVPPGKRRLHVRPGVRVRELLLPFEPAC